MGNSEPRIWNDNSKHYILYMDIMGFKDRVLRTDHNVLHNKLIEFKEKNRKLKPLLEDRRGDLTRMAQFSDSIILSSHNTDKNSLKRIVRAACILMQVGLETGFALKGVIAKGKFSFDKDNSLYFGEALVDAYLLEEELKYYGVAFHHSVEAKIEEYIEKPPIRNGHDANLPLVRIPIPLKSCNSEHWIVSYQNLNSDLSIGDRTREVKQWLRNICHTVSGAPRVYIDNTIKVIEESNKQSNK